MKSNSQSILRVLVTMGESAGIGPELLVRIAQLDFSAEIIVLADPELLLTTAAKMKLELKLQPVNWAEPAKKHQPGTLIIEAHRLNEPVVVGQLNPKNATSCLSLLARAGELALKNQVDAIVTAPVHKANLNQEDSSFLGHTEFFASQASTKNNNKNVVMMLATNELRVTLATTHIALSDVPGAITNESLTCVLDVILNSFEDLNIQNVKVAVCGLNPHAGENGLLGLEDQNIILPVINKFQAEGKQVFGPFPADTLFTPQKRALYDVFLAMYHDQGLPVVKAFGFGQCANITLGLPYIRTSVDHGTALDIASEYKASPDSLVYAINYAIGMAAGQLPA